MVKQESSLRQQHESEASSSNSRFKGVRKRKWGKYVSEIRLPNSRKRIWLGSFESAEKAARAFDAALFCLRGSSAKFNFPHMLPEIFNARSLTPEEIRVEATRFASSFSGPGRFEDSEPEPSSSISSFHVDSPSLSISGVELPEVPLDLDSSQLAFSNSELPDIPSGVNFPSLSFFESELPKIPLDMDSPSLLFSDGELPEISLDTESLDSFLTLGSAGNIDNNLGPLGGYENFQGYDDLCIPEIPSIDDYGNEDFDFFRVEEGSSFLWNF